MRRQQQQQQQLQQLQLQLQQQHQQLQQLQLQLQQQLEVHKQLELQQQLELHKHLELQLLLPRPLRFKFMFQYAPVACLSCNETDAACETATASYNVTIMCTGGCWVYREQPSAGNVTWSRGCGRSDTSDTTCGTEQMSERCMDVSGVSVCRRCCTAASCNHVGITLSGKASAAHVSLGVLMASLVMVLFARESA
ncbi:Hypp5125 [Branchiostoma lanceolatum]|uniref:Hypp5125 protein n=1 Tax=Branchiostoma lanceolatum TaxID=7740 RepID=A0A8K0AGC5_BRALA|nr:Hypp5125 [Branchiostoma lanceolatum]